MCADIELGAGAGPINEYASSLGDLNGGLFVASNGVLVLQVVGDPQPHRDALASDGGACVIEVPRSETEQRQIQESLSQPLADMFGQVGFSTSTGPGGRVDIGLPVVDRETARRVAELVDDPTSIRIGGMGIIVG